jgi:uncharacterized protein
MQTCPIIFVSLQTCDKKRVQRCRPANPRSGVFALEKLNALAQGDAMRSGFSLLAALVGLLLALAACQQPPTPAPAPAGPSTDAAPLHLDHAQTNLPVVKLWVGGEEMGIEVCRTAQQLATGMMFRTNLAERAGMLFVFGFPHRASFYMKNTTVPLSVAYLDPDGVILELHDLKPLDETGVEANTDRIQYVLEVNQGWFARHQVTTGAVVRLPQGPLKQALRP